MDIRKVTPEEYEAVHSFYFNVIEYFDAAGEGVYRPGWQKDVYPAPEQLRTLIANGELYCGKENGRLLSVMALNHDFNEGYDRFDWQTQAEREEIFVIHMLAVLPSRAREGLATEMVAYAVKKAREGGGRVVRLDVLKGNLPANRLYESAGFRKLHTLSMYYPDTGYTDYELYELVL